MKLYGVLVAQNEGDIIEDTLEFLRNINIFEKIFFFDLGSEDDTFIKAKRFTDILHNPQILNEVYTPKLRYDLLAQHQTFYKEGGWLAIIDADEFYVDNPIELINIAEKENATCIKTYQAEFMFTDIDLVNFENEDTTLPIYKRRKHYLIEWSEERFYKFMPDHGLLSNSKPCSKRLLNRHYQYRTPEQIKNRIKTRLENKKKAKNLPGRSSWSHIYSENWKDYIIPHNILHKYAGGEFIFGIPEGVRWKDYYSKNPFSSLFPQLATALKKERVAKENALNPQKELINNTRAKYQCEERYESGSIRFKNCYSKHVMNEILCDFRANKWKEAILGLSVLIRHLARICGLIYSKNRLVIREI